MFIYYALTDSISSMDPSPKDSSCIDRVCPVSGDSMYVYGYLAMCAYVHSYVHLHHVPSRQ